MKIKKVLVTGANGFVGKNLVEALLRKPELDIFKYDIENSIIELEKFLEEADFIFHLAGVNRPERVEEYRQGNMGFTQEIVNLLEKIKKNTPILFSSSIQAKLDNPYGQSKKEAEEVLKDYGKKNKAAVFIYRLPNVFGKWSRPNYNSAVATFCYNVCRGLDIQVSDVKNEITLVYIDDVVDSFLGKLAFDIRQELEGDAFCEVVPTFTITLGELVDKIYQLRDIRKNSILPDLSDRFTRYLYATYSSFLDEKDFSYPLELKQDKRGHLFELIKSENFGQIFVSTTKPGITRGNHFHHTKVEKFCVIKGQALIKFRQAIGNRVISYPVSGEKIEVVDIPPGYTHSIENTGNSELITLFWASEIFDPQDADTYYLAVENG